MTDRETLSVYDAQAEDYKKRFSGTATQNVTRFLSHLAPASRILDVGCGPGGASLSMQEAGHSVIAIDASQGMVETARASGIDARQASFDDLPSFGPVDAVWANFSLLHAPRADLPRHLSDIRGILPTGGIFHIGMKTGSGEKRDALGRRYSYVSQSELTDLMKTARLSVFDAQTGASEGLDGVMASWVILLARADD